MSLLKVSNIEAGYGKVQVLWDITFEIGEEEIFVLLGSNGAGKTTTLRVISGLIHPYNGTITFNGKDLTKLQPHEIVEHGVIHVPEGRRIFPKMTVYENLRLGAYTKRAEKHFHDSLSIVYKLFPILKERRNQIAGTLSGGEQQMLAIARGLMGVPKILLLDEPSLGLAPKVADKIFGYIKEINQLGVTLLLVEQNVFRVLELADRGAVIENGRLVLSGSADELRDNPHIKKAYLGL